MKFMCIKPHRARARGKHGCLSLLAQLSFVPLVALALVTFVAPVFSQTQKYSPLADPIFVLNNTTMSDIDANFPRVTFHRWLSFHAISTKVALCGNKNGTTGSPDSSCVEARSPLNQPAQGYEIFLRAFLAKNPDGTLGKPEFEKIELQELRADPQHRTLRIFKTLAELGSYFDSLERCFLLMKAFKSVPAGKDAKPPLKDESGAWETDSRPLNAAYESKCKEGHSASVTVYCGASPDGRVEIPMARVIENSDPTGETTLMISKEDYELLQPLLWRGGTEGERFLFVIHPGEQSERTSIKEPAFDLDKVSMSQAPARADRRFLLHLRIRRKGRLEREKGQRAVV